MTKLKLFGLQCHKCIVTFELFNVPLLNKSMKTRTHAVEIILKCWD